MNIDSVIQSDWASDPDVMEACSHVWHALSSRKHQLDHYTLDDLLHMAQTDDEPLVTRALSYLTNPKVKVLKICLMYEFDGSFYELPEEEVRHYSRGEPMIHPELGEPIPESRIMLCFTPGVTLRNNGADHP